jgi:2-polyprenyl-3-methyl-5-hydroxy-6-metoxy-1,4-benzoquinol methylase
MHSFKKNIPAFSKLLSNIDAASITADAYAQQYLMLLLKHKIYYLNIYATVLDAAFAKTKEQIHKISMLDFGCGNGLLALFAKFSGVGFVAASDMNVPFLLSAQQLSKQLDLPLDQWVIGNEDILPKAFQKQRIDIIVATDVIEHIYNLDKFFTIIKQLNNNMISVFTTASIAENPIKSKQLQSLQRKDELSESNALHSNYHNDFVGLSFLDIRKKLIQQKFQQLDKDTIDWLASATRGKQENDIYIAVDDFIRNKTLPIPIQHPTNTCDPITGSWTERLLTINEYQELYYKYDFRLDIYYGYFNEFESGLKFWIAKMINQLLFLLGKKAKLLSPFMVLVGKNKNANE